MAGGKFVLRSRAFVLNPESPHGDIQALRYPHIGQTYALPAGKTYADYKPLLLKMVEGNMPPSKLVLPLPRALERIRSYLAAEKKEKKRKRTPPVDPSNFPDSRDLTNVQAAVEAMREAAKSMPAGRQPIKQGSVKHSKRSQRWGHMAGAGYGGPRVGNGFHKPPISFLSLARGICGMVQPLILDQMFGQQIDIVHNV